MKKKNTNNKKGGVQREITFKIKSTFSIKFPQSFFSSKIEYQYQTLYFAKKKQNLWKNILVENVHLVIDELNGSKYTSEQLKWGR